MKTFYDDFVIDLKRSAEEQEKIEREIYELNVTFDQILKIDYKKLPEDIQSDLAWDLYQVEKKIAGLKTELQKFIKGE